MKSKTIIKILSIVLASLVTYIGISTVIHIRDSKSIKAFKNVSTSQITHTKNWSEVLDRLQTKLKQETSISVLEGTIDIQKTFTNKDYEGKGNLLGFLKQKFANLQSRTMTISSTYKFGYAFDVSDLHVEDLGNGNIHIRLLRSDLNIKYIEEIGSERVISDEYGLLGKQFTPQETSALMERLWLHVSNTVNNSTEIRDRAMIYAESTIKGLAESFGFENVEVEIVPDFLIENDEVEIKSMGE